jgi:hypothetical protein
MKREFVGANHNKLMVTVLNLMGVPDREFGDPDFSSGPLFAI